MKQLSENRIIYYTDAKGKKHEIKPLKSKLSFPCPTKEEYEALKKELEESACP